MKDCPFCQMNEDNCSRIIEETEDFIILSDIGPIVEGHLLLFPKRHITCLGAMNKKLEASFLVSKDKIENFLFDCYLWGYYRERALRGEGFPFIFEHGVTGQTVFHAHMHFIPTTRSLVKGVLEKVKARKVKSIRSTKRAYNKDGKYLYFEEYPNKYIVTGQSVPPKFLRLVVAELLGVPERGDWKKVTDGQEIVKRVKEKWNKWQEEKQPFHQTPA